MYPLAVLILNFELISVSFFNSATKDLFPSESFNFNSKRSSQSELKFLFRSDKIFSRRRNFFLQDLVVETYFSQHSSRAQDPQLLFWTLDLRLSLSLDLKERDSWFWPIVSSSKWLLVTQICGSDSGSNSLGLGSNLGRKTFDRDQVNWSFGLFAFFASTYLFFLIKFESNLAAIVVRLN